MRSRLSRHLLPLGTCVLGFCAASAATAAEDRMPASIEEIIVTAEKRTESLQDVSVSISAFTADMRDRLGILSIQDMTNYTPGLSYSTGFDRARLRGIGRFTNNLASDPGVATYSDGLYTSSTVQAGTSPLFVERVEILRGPQGTLYGRNSIGGAINVISRRPSPDFYSEVRADIGNYGAWGGEALVTGPLTDNLRYLVGAGHTQQDDGYFTNVNGGPDEGDKHDDQFYMVQLDANFGDLDVWMKYQRGEWWQRRRSLANREPYVTNFPDGGLVRSGSLGPSALYNSAPGLFPALQPYTETNPTIDDLRDFNTNTPFLATLDDNHQFLLEATYHLGWADLKYVGGFQEYVYKQVSDFDGIDREFYDYVPSLVGPAGTVRIFNSTVQTYIEDKEYYSHELNLSSTTDGPVQWLLGLYQYHEEYHQPLTIGNSDQTRLATPCYSPTACAATPAPANPDQNYYMAETFMDAIESRAIYGQIDWQFAPAWNLVFGLRYTEDEKSADERTRSVYWDPTQFGSFAPVLDLTPALTANGQYARELDDEWSATTGTLGLEWVPNDETLTYLKYTRGYKSGGFNSGTIAADPYVDSEFVNAYEIGAKAQLTPTFQANAAAFYYDYRDAQSPVTVVPTTGPTRTEFLNLPRSESMGLELETTWLATDNLQVLFNYAWLDATIEKACCFLDAQHPALGGQDLAGNTLPASPEHKLALNLLYTFYLSAGSLTLSATDAWRDEQNFSIFDNADTRVDDFNQVDFRVTWADAANRYTVIAFVRNAFDSTGFDGATADRLEDGQVATNYYLTPPRTYGVQLHYVID